MTIPIVVIFMESSKNHIKGEFVKTREFTLVINLVNFPLQCQFRLKNENIEFSGNLAKLRKGDSRWLCLGWVLILAANESHPKWADIFDEIFELWGKFYRPYWKTYGSRNPLWSRNWLLLADFPWFLCFVVEPIFREWKNMVWLVLNKVTSIFICTKWIILQEKIGFWAFPIHISKYFQ